MSRPSFLQFLWRESGQTLLIVLTIMLAVTVSATSFIWYMNQQQTRAGQRYRAVAALHLAQAGLQRALAILESAAPDGTPGAAWRPRDYQEALNVGDLEGHFTLTISDEPDGALLVESDGQVGSVVRRLHARVYLASPAFLAAVAGRSSVRFDGSSGLIAIFPYGALPDRPWIHLAAGREVWFGSPDVRLNDGTVSFPVPPGPLELAAPGEGGGASPVLDPARLLVGPEAELALGPDRQRVDLQQLRVAGLNVAAQLRRADPFPTLPAVDRGYYRSLAEANAANVEINRVAGRFAGDEILERKEDSLYSAGQFDAVIRYLGTRKDRLALHGMIYVTGRVTLPVEAALEITDGALIAENTVTLGERALLRITHTPRTRALPGIILLENGGLLVRPGSRLAVHGLIYTAQTVEIAGEGTVEVVGALASNDPGTSVRSRDATLVIRYDQAVLGTPGLRMPGDGPVSAWVAEWREVAP